MSLFHDDLFLFRSFSVLILILGVAFVAYALKNRSLFIAGTLGSLLGFGFESGVRTNSYLGRLQAEGDVVFWGGLFFAIAFGLIVLLFQYGFVPLLRSVRARFFQKQ